MANWQERIRQAREPEANRLKAQQDAERLWAQQEKDRKLVAIRQEQQNAVEIKTQLLSTLEKISARDLLEQIRKEVWTVGTVDLTLSFKEYLLERSTVKMPCAFLALRFQYKTAYEKTRSYGNPNHTEHEITGLGRHSEGTGNWRVSTAETSLVVKAYCIPSAYTGRDNEFKLGVDDSYASGHWKDPGLNSSTLSRASLDALVLEDCVRRTRGQGLPLQREAQGKAEIERRVPIAFRLFN